MSLPPTTRCPPPSRHHGDGIQVLFDSGVRGASGVNRRPAPQPDLSRGEIGSSAARLSRNQKNRAGSVRQQFIDRAEAGQPAPQPRPGSLHGNDVGVFLPRVGNGFRCGVPGPHLRRSIYWLRSLLCDTFVLTLDFRLRSLDGVLAQKWRVTIGRHRYDLVLVTVAQQGGDLNAPGVGQAVDDVLKLLLDFVELLQEIVEVDPAKDAVKRGPGHLGGR